MLHCSSVGESFGQSSVLMLPLLPASRLLCSPFLPRPWARMNFSWAFSVCRSALGCLYLTRQGSDQSSVRSGIFWYLKHQKSLRAAIAAEFLHWHQRSKGFVHLSQAFYRNYLHLFGSQVINPLQSLLMCYPSLPSTKIKKINQVRKGVGSSEFFLTS